jgi:hypothetical protein
VKEIKSKFSGATVNDVLTALLNMTVRRYFEEKNDAVLQMGTGSVRGNFPINMRDPRAPIELGNRFSAGAFQFDFEYKSRIDLIWRVKRQVDAIKVSPQVQYI